MDDMFLLLVVEGSGGSLEDHIPFDGRVNRVVFADHCVVSCVPLEASLSDEDVVRLDLVGAELLDSEFPTRAVFIVLRGACLHFGREASHKSALHVEE